MVLKNIFSETFCLTENRILYFLWFKYGVKFSCHCVFRDEDLREDEIDQVVDANKFILKQREEGDGHEQPEGIVPDLPPNAGQCTQGFAIYPF